MAKLSRTDGSRKQAAGPAPAGSASNRNVLDDLSRRRPDGLAGTVSATVAEASVTGFARAEGLTPGETSESEVRFAPVRAPRALQGRIEKISLTRIDGWAWDPETPDERIQLELVEDDKQLLVVEANHDRPDLVELGCGDGGHGFSMELDHGLLSEGVHVLGLRCASTGAALPGSPIVFEVRSAEMAKHAARSPTAANGKQPAFQAYIDKVSDGKILGWIMTPEQPSLRYTVAMKEGGRTLARVVASQFRQDLLEAGLGDGCYSFAFQLPGSLLDGQEHMIEIVEDETGTPIAPEPVRWRSQTTQGQTVSARSSDAEFVAIPSRSTDIASVIRGVVSSINNRNDPRPRDALPREVTISLAKLHSLADAEAIFHAHEMILGCVPSSGDFSRLVNALRRGTLDRRQMIAALQREPKARRVRLIEDAPEPGPIAASSDTPDERMFYLLDEFAATDADAFLSMAFRAILRRDPGPSDRATFRDSVSDDGGRSELLLSLLNSEEFHARRQPLAIHGITPTEEVFRLLFFMTERMSRAIMEQDYELRSLRHKLEEI